MEKETKAPIEDAEALSRQPSSIMELESHHMDDEVHKKEPSYVEADLESQRNSLHQVKSHMSTHDATPVHDQDYEEGDEVYDKFTAKRKTMIVSILSFCSFLAPMSSTSILSASPEVWISTGSHPDTMLTPHRSSARSILLARSSTSVTPSICCSWAYRRCSG